MLRSNHTLVGTGRRLAVCALLALGGTECAAGPGPQRLARESAGALPSVVPADPIAADRGAPIYERYCATCHGDHGDGHGTSATWMTPRPRNFVAAVYKCRSTPSGSLPLPGDLRRTVAAGIHATAMPGWQILGDEQVDNVVEYVRSFSPRWRTEALQRPIPIPAEPADTAESRARGHATYDRVGCAACHGTGGRGDGPAVPSLRDDSGNAIVPFDFTGDRPLRCGSSAADLYRTFETGVDGTPMPSFSSTIEPGDAWDLVHYVMSLRH